MSILTQKDIINRQRLLFVNRLRVVAKSGDLLGLGMHTRALEFLWMVKNEIYHKRTFQDLRSTALFLSIEKL